MRQGLFLVILAVLAAFAAGAATAQVYAAPRAPYARSAPPGVLPLDRILPGIRRSHPGQFYDADGPTPGLNGSQHYHLKWMTPDGRIEWLDTDARTGRVLGASAGRDNFDGPGPERYYRPAPSYPAPQPFAGAPFRGGPGGWPGPFRNFGGNFGNRAPLGHDGYGHDGYGRGGGGGWRGRDRGGR